MFTGLLELEPGTILFAWPLQEDGIYQEKDNIAESWCLDGYAPLPNVVPNILTISRHDFLSKEDVKQLDIVQDLFLGPPKEMTSTEPMPDPNNPGCLIGGTAFEHCGQNPVKGSGRCYSLTMTHQHQRALVGPTAVIKWYKHIEDDDSGDLNLEIRGKITQVNCITILFFKTSILIFHL